VLRGREGWRNTFGNSYMLFMACLYDISGQLVTNCRASLASPALSSSSSSSSSAAAAAAAAAASTSTTTTCVL